MRVQNCPHITDLDTAARNVIARRELVLVSVFNHELTSVDYKTERNERKSRGLYRGDRYIPRQDIIGQDCVSDRIISRSADTCYISEVTGDSVLFIFASRTPIASDDISNPMKGSPGKLPSENDGGGESSRGRSFRPAELSQTPAN